MWYGLLFFFFLFFFSFFFFFFFFFSSAHWLPRLRVIFTPWTLAVLVSVTAQKAWLCGFRWQYGCLSFGGGGGGGGKKLCWSFRLGGSQGCVGLRDSGYRLLLVRGWGWGGLAVWYCWLCLWCRSHSVVCTGFFVCLLLVVFLLFFVCLFSVQENCIICLSFFFT